MADRRVWTYSFSNVIVLAGGVTIHGLSPNNTVRARRDRPKVTHTPGMPVGTRGIAQSDSGTVQIALQQSSPSNKFFSDKYQIQVAGRDGDAFALRVYNTRGGELIRADCAWVMDMAEITLQEELTERQWTLQCDNLKLVQDANYSRLG